jgi:beta-lactamase class A
MRKKQLTKHKYKEKLIYIFSLALITLTISRLIFIAKDSNYVEANQSKQCDRTEQLNLTEQKKQLLQGSTNNNQTLCYQLSLQSELQFIIDSNTKVKLQSPDNKVSVLQGKKDLVQQGEYLLVIDSNHNYEININTKAINNSLVKNIENSKLSKTKTEQFTASSQENNLSRQLIYNQTIPPRFKPDKKLQNIVDNIIAIAKQRGLKTDKLSISLVDLNSNKSDCCTYASFADNHPRYPASVVKLFWMVILFGQYEANQLKPGTISEKTLIDLIQDSDNEAGSLILDTMTNTESGSALPLETIKAWRAKRDSVNLFFEKAGYTNINISQKTFPIPYLKMNLPTGRDKQLRDKDLKLREQEINPIRNYLTTYSVARLLYEIDSNQSISSFYNNEMKKLLKRDLNQAAWKNKPFNAIEGFLGEGLPPDTNFYSKMGWTFSNRNDAAIIVNPDGKAHYILVIFGDDKSFYEDKKFLPKVSELVYQQMTKD